MKVIRGLALASKEGVDIRLERDEDEVICEVQGDNFTADFVLPRRQYREMRDWLNHVLDD